MVNYLEGVSEMCQRNMVDLIVTDDRSTDESLSFLNECKQEVTINSGRKGFAANVNNGIRYAQSKANYDYFIIANNDIVIKEGLFEIALPKALSEIAERRENPGLIGFDEILEERNDFFHSFDFNQYSEESVVTKTEIPGFFFIITRQLLNAIGFMDEDYFMYGEDNDYFLRTLKAGFTIYDTALPVRHYSEGSSSNSKMTSWYVYRNAILCAQKNKGLPGVLRVILALVYIVYNPFYRKSNPSVMRIRRSGFLHNNKLLVRSLFWNFKFYLNQFNEKRFNRRLIR